MRWDRFNSHYSESTTGSAFSRTDTELSPRAALVFKPSDAQSFYASFGSSYNPAIEYLTLAPSDESLSPEKDATTEMGTKLDFLQHRLTVTGAVFDTLLVNAREADPDDPTVQQVPFDQRVLGRRGGRVRLPHGRDRGLGLLHASRRPHHSDDRSAGTEQAGAQHSR